MIISVSGGKGGTGKSTVAVNLAVVLAREKNLVLGDLDVEAPNDYILLNTRLENEEPANIMMPFVDYPKCIKCRACGNVCDTGAMLISKEGIPYIIPRLCSGCRACYYVCPTKAIIEGKRTIGYTYETDVNVNNVSFKLVTGVLREGEEHTPPLVLATRRRLFSISSDIYLVDTSAGTSNNVSTAILGSKLLIGVTEPTPLGLHDLEMILILAQKMDVEVWVVINRYGLGSMEKHEEIIRKYGYKIVAKVPYSRLMVESYIKGVPIVAYRPESKEASIFNKLANMLREVVLYS